MARHDDDDDFDDRPASRRRRYHDEDDDRDEGRGRRRNDDDEPEYDFGKRDEPHSGLGIASFVLAIVAGIALLVLFAIAGVMAGDDGGLDEESPAAITLGVMALGACALTLLGLGLGVGALVQKDRNKVFGILGVVANGLALLGASTLICVGAMMN